MPVGKFIIVLFLMDHTETDTEISIEDPEDNRPRNIYGLIVAVSESALADSNVTESEALVDNQQPLAPVSILLIFFDFFF